jgi:alkanesulfonate monooxygenase SsuD/methylene tetrahydromethanopterin reductase-like flavin-dependent oxidoreductase (luciferase family)
MWYAAGNVSSYAMAARKGLGVLGFSVGSLADMDPILRAYKAEIVNAEPVGAYVNDNIMVATAAFVCGDPEKARQSVMHSGLMRQTSNMYRYHDTFPRPHGIPAWPELLPDLTPEAVSAMVDAGALICGTPDDALRDCQRWESAGADQLVFATGLATREESLETIRLIGEHVIPKIDKDPAHRTTRFRDAAAGIRL